MRQTKTHLVGQLQRPKGRPENIELIVQPRSDPTTEEGAAGITIVDGNYPPGDVRRYGAKGDSASGTQGTDDTEAFQRAVDSGHAVYVPEGWYSIEGTVELFNSDAGGGVHMVMTAGTRLERYTNVTTPLLHISGTLHKVEGNGATIAARNFGGFSKGLVLLGPDPAAADNTGASVLDTVINWISDLKIIGKTSNTGWDGSVGFYMESAARKRGQFITPNELNCYYNTIVGVYTTQFDYGFFLSTDANANSLTGCVNTSFGHSAFHINGYANQITDVKVEKGSAQDATERYTFNFGNKDSGPESDCDLDATEYSITGITKGATTVVTIGTHSITATDKVKVFGITDSGAGDLEAALNGGHFEVTAIAATTVTLSVDTSGVSATWSSGGTVADSIYPILGARANQIHGFVETAYDASTQKIRLVGVSEPLGSYDATDKSGVYGRNVVRISGTSVGGIGPSGSSADDSLLNNHVDQTSVFIERHQIVDIHNFRFERLDDDTGNILYKDSTAVLAGRKDEMDDSYTYDLFSIDNVGITSASVLIEVTYQGKESATQDHTGGKVVWMCPVTASTQREPIVVSREIADFGGSVPFYLTCTEAAGTAANTGKFTVSVITQSVSGNEHFCSWSAKLVASNLNDGTSASLDWLADVSYLSSSTSGLVTDTEWKSITRYKDADESVTSSVTMQEDNDLNGWNLKEDEVYRFHGHLRYFENGGDLKITWEFTNAPQTFSWEFQAAQDNTVYYRSDSDHTVEETVTALPANQESFVSMSGFFKGNSSTAGSVAINWAQNTSSGNATILREGSWITVERMGPGS